jgi:hypothetical protein
LRFYWAILPCNLEQKIHGSKGGSEALHVTLNRDTILCAEAVRLAASGLSIGKFLLRHQENSVL